MPPPPVFNFRYENCDPALGAIVVELRDAVRQRGEGWADQVRIAVEKVREWARAHPLQAAELVELPSATATEAEDALARDTAVECIMLAGSKSFSHALNALERSLPLLRELFPGHRYAGDPGAWAGMKQALRAAWSFHSGNQQFCEMIVDKLLNYRVVDAPTVFEWILDRAGEGMYNEWVLEGFSRSGRAILTVSLLRLVQILALEYSAYDFVKGCAARQTTPGPCRGCTNCTRRVSSGVFRRHGSRGHAQSQGKGRS